MCVCVTALMLACVQRRQTDDRQRDRDETNQMYATTAATTIHFLHCHGRNHTHAHSHTYTTINGYRCMQMLSQQTRKSVRMHTHEHLQERTLTNTRTHYTKHTRNMNRVQRRTSANRHSGGSRTTSTTHLVCVCVCVLHRCVHLHANVRMCGNASHAAARNQYIHKILYAVPLPACLCENFENCKINARDTRHSQKIQQQQHYTHYKCMQRNSGHKEMKI